MTASRTAVAAGVAAACLAIYEAVAIITNEVPTITEMVEWLPDVFEVVIIGGLILWLVDHFGWVNLRRQSEKDQ